MIEPSFVATDPAWRRFVAQERERFLDAVTSDADEALRLYDQLYGSLTDAHVRRSAAERRAEEWRVRFVDRDNYSRLLERELLDRRRVVDVDLGEQASL